jgi:uncharacterized protein (TIGR04255 family)
MTEHANPFKAEILKDVHLSRAPLVVVLAQVKFPTILSIEKRDFVAPFQELIRDIYPKMRESKSAGLLIGPGGVNLPSKEGVRWRFADADGQWRVTLGTNFISLETRKYLNRDDFVARLKFVIEAANEIFKPKLVERLGLRYVNRIVEPEVNRLPELLSPSLLGILASEGLKGNIEHTLTESQFKLDDDKLLARWGLLPISATTDPNLLPPLDSESWVLDLDMFGAKGVPFDAADIATRYESYACRIYSFFRWAITDEFMKVYGGSQ